MEEKHGYWLSKKNGKQDATILDLD